MKKGEGRKEERKEEAGEGEGEEGEDFSGLTWHVSPLPWQHAPGYLSHPRGTWGRGASMLLLLFVGSEVLCPSPRSPRTSAVAGQQVNPIP
jgi:hypothetical protein